MKVSAVKKLKSYFENSPETKFAFLFGSRAKGHARASSDWDIGVYLKSV